MKNLSIVLNTILLVAVAVLFYFQFSSKPSAGNSDVPVKTANAENNGNVNIAFVEMDSLLVNYTFYKDSKELLMSKQKQAEESLINKTKAWEKKVALFQERVQKQLVTTRQAEDTDSQLRQEQQGLLQLKDQLSYQLLSDEQAMNRQIYDSILSYLNDYNKIHKYDIILTNTGANTIIYGSPQFDITQDVIKGVNTRYEGSDKQKETQEEK